MFLSLENNYVRILINIFNIHQKIINFQLIIFFVTDTYLLMVTSTLHIPVTFSLWILVYLDVSWACDKFMVNTIRGRHNVEFHSNRFLPGPYLRAGRHGRNEFHSFLHGARTRYVPRYCGKIIRVKLDKDLSSTLHNSPNPHSQNLFFLQICLVVSHIDSTYFIKLIIFVNYFSLGWSVVKNSWSVVLTIFGPNSIHFFGWSVVKKQLSKIPFIFGWSVECGDIQKKVLIIFLKN